MSTAQPIDVRDMAIVHRTLRGVHEQSATLVRAAPAPSPARAKFLADHIDFAIAALSTTTRAKTHCSTRGLSSGARAGAGDRAGQARAPGHRGGAGGRLAPAALGPDWRGAVGPGP